VVLSENQPAAPANENQSDAQSETRRLSRRKAFGRLIAYTAPAMLALLTSEAHAGSTLSPG